MKNVISTYIRTWPLEQGSRKDGLFWSADMVNTEYLTDINIAFALINADDKHSIYIPAAHDFSNLWNEVSGFKKKNPDLKVNISIGGWGAEHFSDMACDSDLREKFSAGVCDWLLKYDLDGVDIDWEYPARPSSWQSIKSRPDDAVNYVSLLKDLRIAADILGEKTKKHYSLSTAVPAAGWFPSVIDVASASKFVDAFKLMAYDYYGGWSSITGHHCNIFKNQNDPSGGWSTDQAVNDYLNAGVPPQKIQMGAAFYGRAFSGVEGGADNDGLFQPFKSGSFPENERYGTWTQLKKVLKPDSGFTRFWDDKAKAPYLYNGDIWITYCDEELIKNLVTYSKEKGLGGFFSWEFGTDINAELLKVLYENAL